MRVAVVGAGIIGASVACHLSGRGAEVVLIDASSPAFGTTSTSFAWVNANNKTPRSYFDLNVAGMEEHRRLSDELGGDWLHFTGNLISAGDSESGRQDLEDRVERLRSWSYPAELMSADEVNAKLEPGVVFPTLETPVAHFPDETWVEAPKLAKRLVEEARANGARREFENPVQGVEAKSGGVEIHFNRVESLEADVVVNAAGPDATNIASMVGRELPLDVFRGLLVRVSAPGDPLGRLLHTPTVNLRPDGDGYILLHHDSVDGRLADDFAGVEDPLCGELLERARKILPTLEGSEVVEARFGRRPVPSDGFSCVGAVPGIPGYYEAVTHSGVTLGPLLGRLLASEIMDGEVHPLLAPYRPGRF